MLLTGLFVHTNPISIEIYRNYFLLSVSSYSHIYISKFTAVYVDKVYDHTKLYRVVYMSSMQVYTKYVVILILYINMMVL